MTLRTVGVRLTAEIGSYQSNLKKAAQSTRDFQGELNKAAKAGKLDTVAHQAGIAGLALTGLAAYAIKSAADFDKAMSQVSAATHGSAADIASLRAAALQAGKDTQYSATQAADGITELSKAGVSTASILNGGLKGALSLAAAGQLDVGEAAETAASAMTQFKLSGDKVPHVADLLAAAAGKAQGSVHDMGYALNQSGLVAAQFGLSIEDTTGALAEFANAGLVGSDAGTSFKTMLLAIANPSGITAKKMQELGLSFYDAQGRFIGLGGVANELRDKLSGLTQEERNAALGQIFGNDAIRAATVLYSDGAKVVEQWKNKVNDAGYASDTAAKLTDNLAGDIERLKGSVETLAIQSGSGANGGLRVLVKAVNSLVNGFLSLPGPIGSTITVLAGLSGGALLLGAGWIKLRRSTAEMRAELVAVGPAGAKAAAGMSRISAAAGKVGLVFAALQAAGAVVHHFQSDLGPQVDALASGLEKYATGGKLAGEASRVLGDNLDDLKVGFSFLADSNNSRLQLARHLQQGLEAIIPGLSGTNTSLAKTKERIDAMDAALAQLVAGGNAGDAQQVFTKLARELAVSGVSMDEFRKQFPQYAAAIEVAGKGTADMTSDVDKLAGAADSASGEVMALSKSIDELFQQQMSADRAAIKLAQSTNDLAAELVHGTRTLSLNSAEGRKNRAAVLDQLEAIEAVRDARVRGGAAIDAANKKYVKDIDGLRKIMTQAGFTQKQIDGLTGAYKRIPSKIEGKVSAPGATQAKKELDLAYTSANGFAGPYVAHISVSGYDAAAGKLVRLSEYQKALKKGVSIENLSLQGTGGKLRFAGGGWTGPGSKYQPAGVVHADEFVIQKESRQRIEAKAPGLLDRMNTTGEVPGYAGGGQVWPFPAAASMTKVPTKAQALAAVGGLLGGGAGPGGGQTYHWILDVVHRAFPGLHATSTFRKGSVTLSGNRSYHAVGRAVDFPPSKALAEWVNANYGHATRELITPWNSLNIKNGSRHAYSGEVFAQHAGTGRFKGNAHDHWAMAHGGVIPEHVVGVGRSGRTYEFGELGPERVTPLRGYASGGLVNVAPAATAGSPAGSRRDYYDAVLSAKNAVAQFTAALKENGRSMSTATQKGRDNRTSLIAGIRAAEDAAKARYGETGSVRAANKVYDEYINKLDQSMKKMHVNTATRRDLIKAYSERPKYDIAQAAASNSSARTKSVQDFASAEDALSNAKTAFAWTKPTFSARTVTGRAELQNLFAYLGAAEQAAQSQYQETGNAGSATKLYNSYIAQLRTILSRSGMPKTQIDALMRQYGRITLTRNRWGGLYEHAATGGLRDAQIAAGGPTRYAWAESSTGGELFAPKNGNLQKTRQEVGWAVANWWGGQVNWGGQSGGARHITVDAPISIQLGSDTIVRQVRFEVDAQLAQVTAATVYQTA